MAFILRKQCLQKHRVHAHLMYKVTNFILDNLHCTNAGQNHLSREGLLWNSIWKAFLSATSWLTSMPKEQRSVCSTNRWYTELHTYKATHFCTVNMDSWLTQGRPEAAHLISSKDFIRSSRGHLQRKADREGVPCSKRSLESNYNRVAGKWVWLQLYSLFYTSCVQANVTFNSST